MASPLVETKLYIPKLRRSLVARPRLSGRLSRGAASRLTLISAPAGFGKTTLLAEWLAATRTERSAAWLSLEESHRQPASYWTYLITALQAVAPGVGASALPLLQSGQPPIQTVLTTVLNELSTVPNDIYLVLDDYHLVDGPDIQAGMTFLLEHFPPQVHLVVSTREDPALPLARLRARGELVEVRAADLRFTLDVLGDTTGDRKGPVMKAFVYERYGPPERLRMAEVDTPAPNAREVLVKVLAVSVNAADWHVLRGKPLFSRATLGLLRPKHKILGVDVAGQVDAVGSDVTRFKAGDEVYANLLDHGFGGFAEYVALPVGVMSLKPASLSFEEAAAVPMAAVTALQGLRRHGELQPTQKVLVNGASGGVGTFAVQLAKASGAEVTAVTSTRNLDLVRSLGADQVVDYTTTDFARGGRRHDRILDTVGNRSVPDLRRALAEGGKAAVTGFTSVRRLLGVSLRGGKDVAQVQAHVTTGDLDLLSELIEAGRLRPQIDRRYRFAELPAAIAYLEQGHARAKVVVAMT